MFRKMLKNKRQSDKYFDIIAELKRCRNVSKHGEWEIPDNWYCVFTKKFRRLLGCDV
jgi:hypothetical protein